MNKQKLNLYKFNTTLKHNDSSVIVTDICKHFTLQEAIDNVVKFNLDRGFEVLNIELIVE